MRCCCPPIRSFLLALVLASSGGVGTALAQRTTTSQPSQLAMPEAAELKPATKPARKISTAPDSVALRQHLRNASALQTQFKESEALAEYQAALKISPQHYESLWRSAVLSVS
ncbi:MAG: hypothetical protein EOO57_12795, partial [Hymenobacter sp.]